MILTEEQLLLLSENNRRIASCTHDQHLQAQLGAIAEAEYVGGSTFEGTGRCIPIVVMTCSVCALVLLVDPRMVLGMRGLELVQAPPT